MLRMLDEYVTKEAGVKERKVIEVRVGQPWPCLENVRVQELGTAKNPLRLKVVSGLSILTTILLVALTAYGMVTRDGAIIDTVLKLVRDVVFAVLGWGIGRFGSS